MQGQEKEVSNQMTEIRLSPGTLKHPDLLTDILLFEQNWDKSVDLHQCMALVVDIVDQIAAAMADGAEVFTQQGVDTEVPGSLALVKLNCLLDHFYLDLAFSSTPQRINESLLNSLSYVIRFHTGESLSMSILLNHVVIASGFDSSLVVVDHEILLRVTLSPGEYVLIDAFSGELHSFDHQTDQTVLPCSADNDYRVLDGMSLLQIYLTQQKLAFTDEGTFEKALCCIELLIQTMPDDPYQRRDRGFLLHQLDCFKLARDDFEFFIEQCPQDPGAQLLKMQLEEFEGNEQTVH